MTLTYNDYSSGHPWYYKLGGRPLCLKQIRANAQSSDYNGYKAEDIKAIDGQSEPKRSQSLRRLKAEFIQDLKRDISGYRRVIRVLREFNDTPDACEDNPKWSWVHTNVSLKHNHLYNDFAHLNTIDDLLSVQADLFDIL